MSFKNNPLYKSLRNLKWKYINLFSDQGSITRKYHQLMSLSDPSIQAQQRKKIYHMIKKSADARILAAAEELDKKGYLILKFSDLGISTDEVMSYCHDMMRVLRENEDNQAYLNQLAQGKYANRTISYEVYKKGQVVDPLLNLALNDSLVKIAALYVKYFPILEYVGLVYNPVLGGEQFGSQLWHKDTQHHRMLKLFFYPEQIGLDNGPFEFFPPELSNTKYYRYSPQGMSDSQIQQFGLNPADANKFLSAPTEFLLVDVARCLHRGALTKNPRFMSIISYCSAPYSFTRERYKMTGTYQYSYGSFKNENEMLMRNYSAIV